MDHILLILSEQWEVIQVRLASLIAHTQRLSLEAGAVVHRESVRILGQVSQPGTLTRFWEAIVVAYARCVESARQFGIQQAQDFLIRVINYPVTRAHILIGSVGLALGGSVGFLLGVSWRQKLPHGPKMKAIGINRYDGIQGVGMMEDLAMPRITGSHDVLVHVRAAAIDPVDLKISLGYGQLLRSFSARRNKSASLFPLVLGRDCVGVVVEAGHGVTKVDVGDKVWTSSPYWDQGLMAEYVALPETFVARVPPQLSFEGAATIPYSALTLWKSLAQAGFSKTNAKSKRVLVLNAESGVGILAIQVVKAWRGHVTTTCSQPSVAFVQQLGADDVIQYGPNTNFNKELDMRQKFDVVLNNVGPALTDICSYHCKEDEGVVVNTVDFAIPSDSYNFLFKSLCSLWIRLKGLLSQRLVLGDVWLRTEVLEEVRKMVHRSEIRPVVGRSFPVWDADLAFQQAATANFLGKPVLSFSVKRDANDLIPKH